MAWYWHLLIAGLIPIVGIAFALIWEKLVVDDWWTPMIVIWAFVVVSIIYFLIIISALAARHIVIV